MSPLNRYHRFDWQGVPQPGELEYLNGAELRMSARTGYDRLVKMPPALHLGPRNCDARHSSQDGTHR